MIETFIPYLYHQMKKKIPSSLIKVFQQSDWFFLLFFSVLKSFFSFLQCSLQSFLKQRKIENGGFILKTKKNGSFILKAKKMSALQVVYLKNLNPGVGYFCKNLFPPMQI